MAKKPARWRPCNSNAAVDPSRGFGTAASDAFREIRTRLLGLAGEPTFITLVVSVSPRSGGSFVARNLAAAFAFDETKTSLLIDCNLRYPTQHKALEVEPVNGGLIDFLEHPIPASSRSFITPACRVRLIPAGTSRENGGEFFSSFRMRAVLDSLRCRYPDRYLFLDGPAIKGSPDARILSDLADFVVVVVGYGRDTPAAINQAVANFEPPNWQGWFSISRRRTKPGCASGRFNVIHSLGEGTCPHPSRSLALGRLRLP
jgi:protein-tyrosine kinase